MQPELKNQYKTLNFIYIAILISMSVAAIISVIVVSKMGLLPVFNQENLAVIKSVVIIALLAGIPISHIFFFKKIKHIDKTINLLDKIKAYQSAFIARIAMLEGIGILAAIGYLVSADNSFLYMFGVVFILFIIHAPTKNRISNDLNLTEEEEELFIH